MLFYCHPAVHYIEGMSKKNGRSVHNIEGMSSKNGMRVTKKGMLCHTTVHYISGMSSKNRLFMSSKNGRSVHNISGMLANRLSGMSAKRYYSSNNDRILDFFWNSFYDVLEKNKYFHIVKETNRGEYHKDVISKLERKKSAQPLSDYDLRKLQMEIEDHTMNYIEEDNLFGSTSNRSIG